MAFDEGLSQRIREVMADLPGFEEKKMFGGVGFMLYGNMACGVNKDHLIVRVGPERYEDSLDEPFVKPFDLTGRPMKGWVYVTSDGVEEDADLNGWVQQGVDFAMSLPPK
jgi:TfoX/Sxy family transcriptional regulator of competence genes